jgi:SAM-dependent methyltransferase
MSETADFLVQALYRGRVYPPMSHPSADPSLLAVAARLGGLRVGEPWCGRVLEIGSAGGHHLIPLAMRWPGCRLVGIELVEDAVGEARRRARAAGVGNVEFVAADVREEGVVTGEFDFIIAHGFLSWVPEEVQGAMFRMIRRHLAPNGVAVVSYNLLPGWSVRLEIVEEVRRIREVEGGDEWGILQRMAEAGDVGVERLGILRDMLAKGPDILAFDEFGPVNDPWTFERFLQVADAHGLHYLGESEPGENVPGELDEEGRGVLAELAGNPLGMQVAADVLSGRTFRSSLVCRKEAARESGVSARVALDFFYRPGRAVPEGGAWICREVERVLAGGRGLAMSFEEVAGGLPGMARGELARGVIEGISRGWIRARVEAAVYDPEVPERPRLDGFRRVCAEEGIPLVDAWLVPCSFPVEHFEVLALMDGTRGVDELARFARERCPELHFRPWLEHLARRGMFGG